MKLVQEEHMPVCQDAPHRNLAGAVVLQRFTVPFEFAVYFTCGLLSDPSNRTLLQAMSRREPNKRHHFVVVINAGVAQARVFAARSGG